MPNYAAMNPGKYHLGKPYSYPPIENRKYNDSLNIVDIKWKTSALIGRRLYVGNVKLEEKDGKVRVLTDSIFKSKSNKFDSFTLDRRIDVAVGDGEEIIRLAGYADRLLQFKENTLHIINVTQGAEFLEATHRFKGVSHHNAVCETDYGVAWCNTNGVYIYDGEQVSELLIKQGLRTISEDTWNSFYKDEETMIGYIPKSKQLLVVRGISGANSGNIMVFDMITQSWTKGTARLEFSGTQHKTNLVNLWDGRLAFGYESDTNKITVVPWKSASSEVINNYKVETKELNFGTESKKKVIKVRLRYKGGNGANDAETDVTTKVLPKYAIDGGSFEHSFQDENGSNITDIPGSVNWAEIELYTTSNANNIRTFAIQLTDVSSQNVIEDFEINDMTIIFRTKSVK
tara:strand:+ start:1915 stop:3117 length:1203 start_codon:yes stop_codon:yes gene_type:complete